ncbi:MAG: sigma-54-dependent transcriptional regulator [Nitrospirota bacterium]
MADILIVDDEPGILRVLSEILKDEGYQVATAKNGYDALNMLRNSTPSVMLLDIWMPDIDGIEVLRITREKYPYLIVIIMSGHGSIETAVKTTKLGAYDYLEKPLSADKVVLTISHALNEYRLKEENLILKEKIESKYKIIGESLPIKRLMEHIKTAGPTISRILISGENGTGKELVARAIHSYSNKASKPFVEINCAAIPETLIETELFGYEKGAFTGADAVKKGKFEMANKGTLFLDEVGDMSLVTQAKVLRVLQEQRFHRIGGSKPIEVDVRIIAASNKVLMDEIKDGNFREDLYYRLNVIPLYVPPLRDRKDDIPLLAEHFLELTANEYGIKPKQIADGAIEILKRYNWPGNIRELKNVIERLVIMIPSQFISSKDLLAFFDVPKSYSSYNNGILQHSSFKDARLEFEKAYITEKLIKNDWNISKTAEELKIERSHLHRKIKHLGIDQVKLEKS